MSRWLSGGWLRARRELKVAKAREPRKNRTGTFSLVTVGAAVIAFLLALFGVGPFAVQALVINFSDGPLQASQVFPSPSPLTKIVDTYDSPRPQAPSDPESAPAPAPEPVSNPEPHESPEPGDGGGSDN